MFVGMAIIMLRAALGNTLILVCVALPATHQSPFTSGFGRFTAERTD